MEKQSEVIDLKKLLRVLNYYKIYIIVATILITGIYGLFLYVGQSQEKIYSATSQVYLEEKSVVDNVIGGTSDHIIKDYVQLIKSDFILNDVQSKLEEQYTITELQGKIVTSSEESSNIISIEVMDSSAENAETIANQVADSTVTKIEETSEYYDAYISNYASRPGTPISNNILKKILKVFIICLFLLCIVTVAGYFIKDNIKDEEALEKALGAKIVISIPKRKKIQEYLLNYDVFFKLYMTVKKNCNTLLITSIHSGEGKSMISKGLAEQFARNKKKTILVKKDDKTNNDFELRNVESELNVLTVGVECDLLSESFYSCMNQLKSDYDIVIVDGTIFDTADSYVAMEYCNNALIVVDPNNTGMKQLTSLKHKLDKSECVLKGLILNKVKY